MKLSFSLKNKEAKLEADVERLIEKDMDRHSDGKTRYQIRQEEKRKNAELKHKQEMQRVRIGIGILIGVIVIGLTIAVLAGTGILS
jgi:hypothetical protein